MFQWRIAEGAPGVIDQDHKGHSGAAKNVKRHKPLGNRWSLRGKIDDRRG
jgi:hypothetical protein